MKRNITLTERQFRALNGEWSSASGLSKGEWRELRQRQIDGTVRISVGEVTDMDIELDSSLEARQNSWKSVTRRLTLQDGHVLYDGPAIKVQGGTKRLHPLCWALWVHGQISSTQALKWGTKTTFTPDGSKKSTQVVQAGISDCAFDNLPCINPAHYLLYLPGEDAPKVFDFAWGDLENRPPKLTPRIHLEIDLPPGVEPKDEPASATDPLPAHKSYSILRDKVPPNEWTVFMTAPVEPKNPDEPTDYELDRMEAWADQELYRKGAYDDTKFIERVFAKMAKM